MLRSSNHFLSGQYRARFVRLLLPLLLLLLAGVVLLFGMLTGTAAAAAGCDFAVAGTSELNDAIGCYNVQPAGSYTITIEADMTLTATTTAITNPVGMLTVQGFGHVISGDDLYRIFTVSAGDVTIDALSLQTGVDAAVSCGGNSCGGALFVDSAATVTVQNSLFFGSFADRGAAIYNEGTLTVHNSTLNGNSAGRGGAIRNGGTLTLTHSTLSANFASDLGGGLFNNGGGSVSIYNTIIANSGGGGDCHNNGTLIANVGNLIEDNSCSPALSGDPLLGVMVDNGGPTRTHALLAGSPALDSADAAFCQATDQRTVSRPQGAGCDIGAYELFSCGQSPYQIDDTGDLELAIGCYNAETSGSFVFRLNQDLALWEPTPPITNSATTLTINGVGNVIDGANRFRLFNVTGGDVTFNNIVLQNGRDQSHDCSNGDCGGALFVGVAADVTVKDSTLQGNSAENGGAIRNLGLLTVNTSTLLSNTATVDGGAIYSSGGGQLTIAQSTLTGNEAADDGGALHNRGVLTVRKSLLFDNDATSDGGAIYNHLNAAATVENSTLSANVAGASGGGVRNRSVMTMTHATLTGNEATNRGGGLQNSSAGTLTLVNTIVGNSGGEDCHSPGPIALNSHNLIEGVGGGSCGISDGANGTVVGLDPLLGPLQDNGGETETHMLLSGSPALDSADGDACLVQDQRNISRPQGAACDIGAVEYRPSEIVVRGNGLPIDNGDSSPSQGDGTQFPVEATGPVTRSFTIENHGFNALILDGTPAVAIAGSPYFSVTRQPETALGYFESTQFEMTFAAAAAGYQTATVTIANNDSDKDPFNFVISGYGCASQPYVVSDGAALSGAIGCFNLAAGGSHVISVTAPITLTENTAAIDNSAATLTVTGNGHTIDGDGLFRAFDIEDSEVTLADVHIRHNYASNNGGGVYHNGGRLTVINSTLSHNRAEFSGGAIANSGPLIVISSTLSANSASFGGGAIYDFASSTVTVTASSFVSNETGFGNGGAFYSWGSLTINDSQAVSNTASSGGAFYSRGSLTINDSQAVSNTASSGGGIYAKGSVTVTASSFVSNEAYSGGAFYINGALTVNDSQVVSNTANSGGGIYASSSVTVNDSRISGNAATSSDGGAIYAGAVTVTRSEIVSNTSQYAGGAIYSWGSVAVDDSEISFNSAENGNGGGIYATDVTVTASRLFSNTSQNGGAFYLNGALTINDSQVVSNTANSGGGIYASSSVTVNDSRISGNAATSGAGGAIYAGPVTVTRSEIVSNTSQYAGGGIYSWGSVAVDDSEISFNSAEDGNGGGIYATDVTITASRLFSNTSHYGGGGIRAAGNTLIQNSEIASNWSKQGNGGGVYQSEFHANFSVHDSTLRDNRATVGGAIASDSPLTLTATAVLSNTATESGGGIRGYSRIAVIGGRFSHNSSGQFGGAIAALRYFADPVLVISATLSNNSAAFGGALFSADRESVVRSSTLHSNVATGTEPTAGGIHAEGGALTLHNSTVSANTGGGVFQQYDGELNIVQSTLNANLGDGLVQTDGTLQISNSLIAASSGTDCRAPAATTNVNNLIEDGSCSPMLSGDPLLGPLQDNGGSTLTHALLGGSAAIDTGDAAVCDALDNLDQRGYTRFAPCDIGAYEFGAVPTAVSLKTASAQTSGAALLLWIALLCGLVTWRCKRRAVISIMDSGVS